MRRYYVDFQISGTYEFEAEDLVEAKDIIEQVDIDVMIGDGSGIDVEVSNPIDDGEIEITQQPVETLPLFQDTKGETVDDEKLTQMFETAE